MLTVKLGASVTAEVRGHSALNGAVIPDGAFVEFSSNDPTVATVPATGAVPPGGAGSIAVPVTVLALGSTDIHVKVTTPDGVFEDTATLIVEPLPVPGLARVELILRTFE